MGLALFSPAFPNNGTLPPRFACDGADRSPPLRWLGAPDGTGSFALVMKDPDAPRGEWVHWLLYEIPAELRGLGEGLPRVTEITGVGRQGINDYGQLGYGGPCPPPGPPHRYIFTLYALETRLDLPPGIRLAELKRVIQDHILAHSQWSGRYGR